MIETEMRCPVDAQRMFGKIQSHDQPRIVSGNLIEFACDKCRRRLQVRRVLHRFDLAGEFVESSYVPYD